MVMENIKFSLNEACEITTPIVACIGFFDGLHCGHQALINKTIELAKQNQAQSALITFSPDPWEVIKGGTDYQHLATTKRREELAEKMGLDCLITLDFTKEMSKLDPEQFLLQVLVPCKLKALVCGFDFNYGAFGKGNAAVLKEDAKNFFDVYIIDSVNEDDKKISTSRIVTYIEQGEINHANRLLGYRYQIEGVVIHGKKRGREIGFPTANLAIHPEYILPKKGIYEGWIQIEQNWYPTIVNIGHNPTFNFSNELSVEAHILNFDQDIYGQAVRLEFENFLRDEMKFSSIDELVQQMNVDREKARQDLISHEE